jgi:hypothetical protein
VRTPLTLNQIKTSHEHEPPFEGEHLRRGFYFTQTDNRRNRRLHSIGTLPHTGRRPLVRIESHDIRTMLERRMGTFADAFHLPENFRRFEAEHKPSPDAGSSWRIARLVELFVPEAELEFDFDQPLGVWNFITQQVEDVTGTFVPGDGVMLMLSNDTVAGLLRPFYQQLHRALGLDLVSP